MTKKKKVTKRKKLSAPTPHHAVSLVPDEHLRLVEKGGPVHFPINWGMVVGVLLLLATAFVAGLQVGLHHPPLTIMALP